MINLKLRVAIITEKQENSTKQRYMRASFLMSNLYPYARWQPHIFIFVYMPEILQKFFEIENNLHINRLKRQSITQWFQKLENRKTLAITQLHPLPNISLKRSERQLPYDLIITESSANSTQLGKIFKVSTLNSHQGKIAYFSSTLYGGSNKSRARHKKYDRKGGIQLLAAFLVLLFPLPGVCLSLPISPLQCCAGGSSPCQSSCLVGHNSPLPW